MESALSTAEPEDGVADVPGHEAVFSPEKAEVQLEKGEGCAPTSPPESYTMIWRVGHCPASLRCSKDPPSTMIWILEQHSAAGQ